MLAAGYATVKKKKEEEKPVHGKYEGHQEHAGESAAKREGRLQLGQ